MIVVAPRVQVKHDRTPRNWCAIGKIQTMRSAEVIRRPPVSRRDAREEALVRDHDALARASGARTETNERGVQRHQRVFLEAAVFRDPYFGNFPFGVHDGADAGFTDDSVPFRRGQFAGQRDEAFTGAHDSQREDNVRDAIRTVQRDAHGGQRRNRRVAVSTRSINAP